MKQKYKFIAAGSLIFSLFIIFSYLVHKNLFTDFDFNTTVRLQDNLSRRFDGFFSLFSFVGNFEVMTAILLVLLVLQRKIRAIFAFGMFGLLHFIEIFGKSFVEHFPPPEFMLRTEKVIDFPQFYVRTLNSYPSGHTARTGFLSILIGLLVWRSKKLSKTQKYILLSLLVIFDIIMFVSRAYLGEHWSSDVIGGALLGLSLGLASFALL